MFVTNKLTQRVIITGFDLPQNFGPFRRVSDDPNGAKRGN